jgi:hypothetical protein
MSLLLSMTMVLLVGSGLGLGALRARRSRYKSGTFRKFEEVSAALRTGDIILFHKTKRTGFVDSLELDVISPLIFGRNEFRHCGIVMRDGDDIFVLECADEKHSGYGAATYVTGGNGLRVVEIEALMREYTRDNGDPHFGILHIEREIPLPLFREVLSGYENVDYMKTHRTALVLFANAILPTPWSRNFASRYEGTMMCSEFLHHFLHRCGVLEPYHSKTFVTYAIENRIVFRSLQRVRYSEIVRFNYSPVDTALSRRS